MVSDICLHNRRISCTHYDGNGDRVDQASRLRPPRCMVRKTRKKRHGEHGDREVSPGPALTPIGREDYQRFPRIGNLGRRAIGQEHTPSEESGRCHVEAKDGGQPVRAYCWA
jgi:hypothetical protein